MSLYTRAWIGQCQSELGEFDEAAHGEEILQIAQQDGGAYGISQAMLGVAYVARVRDDHPTAILWSERAIELGRTQGVQIAVILGTANLGRRSCVPDGPRRHVRSSSAGCCCWNGRGTCFSTPGTSAGSHGSATPRVTSPGALELARQSVEQAAAQGHRGVLAENRWHLATILAHAGESDAEGTYQEALALADELGMRPLQAHCHLGLGKLYRRTGRPDEARAELATAVAMLREMGMAFWLPEAEVELAGVSRS